MRQESQGLREKDFFVAAKVDRLADSIGAVSGGHSNSSKSPRVPVTKRPRHKISAVRPWAAPRWPANLITAVVEIAALIASRIRSGDVGAMVGYEAGIFRSGRA